MPRTIGCHMIILSILLHCHFLNHSLVSINFINRGEERERTWRKLMAAGTSYNDLQHKNEVNLTDMFKRTSILLKDGKKTSVISDCSTEIMS